MAAHQLSIRQRAILEARLMERLGRMDDATLMQVAEYMESLTRPAPAAAPPQQHGRGWTRRQFVAGTALGSAAIVATSGTAALVSQAHMASQGETLLASATAAATQEQATLRGLVILHEQLERVELDSTLTSGMQAVGGALGALQEAATTVRAGIERAELTFAELDESLAVLDNGLSAAEGIVAGLAQRVQALEDRLESASEPLAPLTQALGGFFAGIIGYIPFGVGDRILQIFERLQEVVTSVPEAILGINTQLLEPMRRRFFPREGGTMHVRLVDPLVGALFSPLERLLDGLSAVTERWQRDLATPAQQRLAERQQLRETIARYRHEHGLS